jgi:hypothetical protein
MCGCVKKGTKTSNIQISNNKVFVNGNVYHLDEDLNLAATFEILQDLYNENNDKFILIKIINIPFDIYIQSKSQSLIEYGYLFYGKYKSEDILYVLIEDVDNKIMEVI